MKVILLQDVRGTGKAQQVVNVSDGYGRNMLIPKGLALEATDKNIKILEKKKRDEAERKAEEKKEALELKAILDKSQVKFLKKAGESGKVFGSITSKEIADKIQEELNIKVDKKKINLTNPIKALGEFNVEIKLYSEVVANLKVKVDNQ